MDVDVDDDVLTTDEESINSADMARMARFQILGEAGLRGMEIDDEEEDYVMVDVRVFLLRIWKGWDKRLYWRDNVWVTIEESSETNQLHGLLDGRTAS
jgi:hypothetical protein